MLATKIRPYLIQMPLLQNNL